MAVLFDVCVLCVLCLCVLLQLAYPGNGNGLPFGASQPRDPSGLRPCGLWGCSTQLPMSSTTALHSPHVRGSSYGRALGAGEGPLGLYRHMRQKQGRRQAPALSGAPRSICSSAQHTWRNTPSSQTAIDATCGRQGRRSLTRLNSTLGIAPSGA